LEISPSPFPPKHFPGGPAGAGSLETNQTDVMDGHWNGPPQTTIR
jgi:hypothetical protein